MKTYILVDKNSFVVEAGFPKENLEQAGNPALTLILIEGQPVGIGDKLVDGKVVKVDQAWSEHGKGDTIKTTRKELILGIGAKAKAILGLTDAEAMFLASRLDSGNFAGLDFIALSQSKEGQPNEPAPEKDPAPIEADPVVDESAQPTDPPAP